MYLFKVQKYEKIAKHSFARQRREIAKIARSMPFMCHHHFLSLLQILRSVHTL
jgi:hypothetical protein